MRVRRSLLFAAAASFALGGAAFAQEGPVKIGVMSDMSGLYADLSGPGSVEAARMAIEDFGGELFGHPIEIVQADHQNRGDLASTIAREWYDEDGVDAVFDVPNSSAALAVQELARERGKFFFISGAATSRLTGDSCSPTGVHWMYDTYALANGTGRALVAEGADTWFFLTADYAFGHSLEQDTAAVVEAAGGEVRGTVRHPLDTQDFSSYLLQAQASGAEIIGLANAGTDTTNSIRQAAEFGIVQAGQRLAGLLLFITDVHALGLDAAQNLVLTTGFYWDRDDQTRAFAQRFEERMGMKPTMIHAGVYSSAMHFFNALEATGSKDPDAVMDQVRGTPVDLFGEEAHVREDGRMVHEMYLVRVKTPEESEGDWDYYEILRTIPGDEAFRPMEEGDCPHVTN
jgi:branched-chain amino acid transport system substrate-binding protein